MLQHSNYRPILYGSLQILIVIPGSTNMRRRGDESFLTLRTPRTRLQLNNNLNSIQANVYRILYLIWTNKNEF